MQRRKKTAVHMTWIGAVLQLNHQQGWPLSMALVNYANGCFHPAVSERRIPLVLHAKTKPTLLSVVPVIDESPVLKSRAASKKGNAEPRITTDCTTDATHWISTEDDFVYNATHLEFAIRGNPLPLRRHRTSRGFMYNPSAKAQATFRQCLFDLLAAHKVNTSPLPLLGNTTLLALSIQLFTRRPLAHFVNGRRSRGLKRRAPDRRSYIRTDVDNLAKFVLDSLNLLAYGDDCQVHELMVCKQLDDAGACLGSTRVQLHVLTSHDDDSDHANPRCTATETERGLP